MIYGGGMQVFTVKLFHLCPKFEIFHNKMLERVLNKGDLVHYPRDF